MNQIIRIGHYILFTVLSILISYCSDNDKNPIEPESYERGDISESALLSTYTKDNLDDLVNTLGLETSIPLSYSVKAYSLNYYTIDKDGKQELASGAIFIPQNVSDLSVVSIQHGTETFSNSVASVSPLNSIEGVSGLIFASTGYVILVPDYLGFGVSTIPHPYMHAKSLTPCVIDFIRAGRSFTANENIGVNEKLFLTGYSEGGYVTLATQKDIEENYSQEFNLTAVAPLAGPYDLRGTADSIFSQQNYSTPVYLGYLFSAYDKLYGWDRINDIFQSPYTSRINSLFDGSKTWIEISSQLPSSFNEFIKPEFVTNYKNGAEADILNALNENSLLDWKPLAPIHFFHGNADEVSFYENAIKTKEAFELRGATNIQLTTIEGGTHSSAGRDAIIGTFEWFESYRN